MLWGSGGLRSGADHLFIGFLPFLPMGSIAVPVCGFDFGSILRNPKKELLWSQWALLTQCEGRTTKWINHYDSCGLRNRSDVARCAISID